MTEKGDDVLEWNIAEGKPQISLILTTDLNDCANGTGRDHNTHNSANAANHNTHRRPRWHLAR